MKKLKKYIVVQTTSLEQVIEAGSAKEAVENFYQVNANILKTTYKTKLLK